MLDEELGEDSEMASGEELGEDSDMASGEELGEGLDVVSDEELVEDSDVVSDEELGDESAGVLGEEKEEASNHSGSNQNPNSIDDCVAQGCVCANQVCFGLGPPRGRKGVRGGVGWFRLRANARNGDDGVVGGL